MLWTSPHPYFSPVIFPIIPSFLSKNKWRKLIREICVLFFKISHFSKIYLFPVIFPISPVIKIYFSPVYFLSLILHSFQNLIGFIDLMELDKLNSSLPAVAREKWREKVWVSWTTNHPPLVTIKYLWARKNKIELKA